jgi:hypothetical protein
MSDDAIEELRDVERRRLRALVDANTAAARQLHAHDYQLITPGGSALTGDEYLADIASGAIDYRVFEPASDVAVKIMGDAGVVRYKARIEIRFGSGGGESALVWHTDIYRRTDAGWQAVWSQATRIRTEPAEA